MFNSSLSLSLHRSRRALTLIEMLIGMAITLVMMAAVVQLFANISQGVRNRRATMEVSAKLRTARAQLYNDLAGATCLKYPKDTHAAMLKPDSNNMPDGYFEIVEGRWSDEDPSILLDGNTANGELDSGVSLVPSSGRLFDAEGNPITPGVLTDGMGLGDYDDILAMTVESQTERFRGRGRGFKPGGFIGTPGNDYNDAEFVDMAMSSPIAEVIWFATETPSRDNPTYIPEMGEPGMRKVYRRVLLIAPWYGTTTQNGVTVVDPVLKLNNVVGGNDVETRQKRLEYLRNFQEKYDISVRMEGDRLVPNTLADLARREHRFAHAPNNNPGAPVIGTSKAYFPYQFPYNVAVPTDLSPLSVNNDDASLRRLHGERAGEDLMLDNVLAFDVQVYDPGAPLFNFQTTTVQPTGRRTNGTDTAFIDALQAYASNPSGPAVLTGYGTYADLGWNNVIDYVPAVGAPTPLFQQARRLGWHPAFPNYVRGNPAVYDTWTTYYETDQSNQEAASYYTLSGNQIPWNVTPEDWRLNITDQGANGLDENLINGPDDPLERETSPPYPYPLHGVQVKIRLYEPESRQIRETTVTRNLAK
jgi:hypothetical protein